MSNEVTVVSEETVDKVTQWAVDTGETANNLYFRMREENPILTKYVDELMEVVEINDPKTQQKMKCVIALIYILIQSQKLADMKLLRTH